MVEKPTYIPSRLKNCAIGGHVAGASDIIDDEKGKTQDIINADTEDSIDSINTAIGDDDTEGTIKGRLKDIEEIIGSGGAIDERIADAVKALDSEVSHTSADNKVAITVTETDGKLTNVELVTDDIASAATVAQNKESLDSDIASINSKIVPEASPSNKLIDKKYVDDLLQAEEDRAKAAEEGNANAISSEVTRAQTAENTLQTNITDEATRAKAAEKANADAIETIEGKIPSQASTSNQLADKEFVNSSISTATATFKGTYNTLEELQAVTADNNDYGFVVSQDAAGNTVYNRYKFDGTQWSFEYALNNSSFTSEQWSSINSGITSEEVNRLSEVATGAQVNVIETIKVNNSALTPTNKAVDIPVPTQLAHLEDDAAHRLVTDIEKTKWDKKQDALTLDGNYDSTTNKVATQSTIKNVIDALDVNDISGFGKGKTLATLKQTDGKVSATFQDISITKSQVLDFPQLGTAAGKDAPPSGNASTTQVVMGNDTRLSDSRTPKEHVHGNIKNGGTLQDTDVTVANGDKLVITDNSDSSKIARASISFDGTTATKALTQKGTWETFGTSNLKVGTDTGDAFDGPTGNSHVNDGTIHVTEDDKGKWNAKADADSLKITPGTGADSDKTTIQLKEGTSATVLTQHQSLGGLQPRLTFDEVPTLGSNNPVKSNGIKEALNAKQDNISDLGDIRSGAALGSTAYQKPSEGIPESDLDSSTQSKIDAGSTAYQKPQGGIPSSDMSQAVQQSLSKADTALQEHQSLEAYYTKTETDSLLEDKQDTIDDLQAIRDGAAAGSAAYQKPEGNIPYSDLSSEVQASLDKADAAAPQSSTYTKTEVDNALARKQDALTFDNVPIENSDNPVKSGGVYSALSGKQDTIDNLQDIIDGANAGATAYQLPQGGIPEATLTQELQQKINSGGNAYTKPDGGIPSSDMTQAVRDSLGKADTAVQPSALNGYQEKLVSGENIKTINSMSVLGSGNITISTTGISWDDDPMMDGEASAGSSEAYSRGDHRHPSDTSKANVAELSITDGTGDDSDKVTIQLKNGLSTTVLKSHQDISGLQEKLDFATSQECIAAAKELT